MKFYAEKLFYIQLCLRLDEMCLRRKEQTGFMPPDRPKRWKDTCFTVLEEWISNRYNALQSQFL